MSGASPPTPSPTRLGLVYVISGPSGAGKDSVIQRLLPRVDLDTVVTLTTRAPRPDEIDGVHYRFVAETMFHDLLKHGDLLEHAYVHGNWYAVPADAVRQSVARGRDVLVKVDPQGARSIKQLLPDAIFIFIRPASLDELRGRLVARASETPEELALRLHNAVQELDEAAWFDYVVDNPNGQIDLAVQELQAIIASINALKGRAEQRHG